MVEGLGLDGIVYSNESRWNGPDQGLRRSSDFWRFGGLAEQRKGLLTMIRSGPIGSTSKARRTLATAAQALKGLPWFCRLFHLQLSESVLSAA